MFNDVLELVESIYKQGSKDHSDQKNTSSKSYLIQMTELIMEMAEK